MVSGARGRIILKRCQLHDEPYTCQICGECYPCHHEQYYDGELWWWTCRFSNVMHRTNHRGQVVEKRDVVRGCDSK
jgi:hypothetical protein